MAIYDPVQTKNNFSSFKEDFTKDTGMPINDQTMPHYIAYYNARVNDLSLQLTTGFLEKIFQRLGYLPADIVRVLGESKK